VDFLDSIFDELVVVLDHEFDLYNDIFRISKEKTGIIVEGKVNELEKIVQAEQKLIIKISQIENQREILTYKISKSLKMKTDEITLSALVEKMEGSLKDKLKERQEGLNKLISELTELNNLNSKLIKNSLDYINFSLNLFADAGSQDNNYGIDAEKSNVKSESKFDFKI
jgi:Mg2+ and Co2+ transporter CorA